MKRQLASFFLAMVMICSLLPVSALGASVTDYPILTNNFNIYQVQNNPGSISTISVQEARLIQAVTTYHWNYGQGATPGTITIYEDGKPMGTWSATGRSGSGASNVYWDIFPNVTFTPGHEYTFSTSSDETWSWNEQTHGAGMMELRGVPASAQSQPNTTTVGGYTCATWAKPEIETAISYSLIPASLSGGDLTKPISRADFAAVSVATYSKMANTTVTASGSTPFTDTSSGEVLKAYQLGIVNGTSATTFSPNDNLTREQASTMLTRAYKKIVLPGWTLSADSSFSLNYTRPAAFADQSSIGDFAVDSVAFMAASGIVNGVGNNTFAPKNTVTRQEALAIAVRMVDKLDTTPQAGTQTATSGSEGPAQGTITNGDCSVTFKTTQKGQAVLVQDGDGYGLLLTDEMEGTVSVTFPASAPADGMENVVYLGVPYKDDDGATGFETFPLDTTYSNGKVTATADLSEYANAIEDAAYSSETATGKTNYSKEFAKQQAAAVGSKIDVKFVVYLFCESEYILTSDAGHFRIYIPATTYNNKSEAVPNKISKEDAKRIVEDLESILTFYQNTYTIKRTSWPMKVILNTGKEDGVFGSGRMKLKWTTLSNGYGRDLTSSQKLYQTMAHEMFHFVQREYAPVALSQSWFDEASATYYGIQFGYQRCGEMSTAMSSENYSSDAEAQYQGIAPMDIATLGWFDFLHAGYGRASFIDYLMRYHGNDFLKRYYEKGISLAGVQTEARLENLTGKSLGELAEDFYDKLVLEKDAVNGVLATPADIFARSYSDGSSEEGDGALDNVRTTWELTGSNESTVIKVPRYGAYFTALDMSKIAPGAKTFTLTVPTADCAARLIAIHSNSPKDQYSVQKVFKPFEGKFIDVPIDGTMYLLMMVNTTGSWGWTVSETLNITYEKLSTSGSYPSSFDEVPLRFQGKATYWAGKAGASFKEGDKGAYCDASYEGGRLSFTIFPDGQGNYDTMFTAGYDGFLNNQGYFKAITSDGGNCYVQMEAGKYVDRTKGPKPTAEQLQEWEESSNPFGIYLEGESTNNVIRIIWFDKFGRMGVFEGTGYNDNGYSYDQPITVTETSTEKAETTTTQEALK